MALLQSAQTERGERLSAASKAPVGAIRNDKSSSQKGGLATTRSIQIQPQILPGIYSVSLRAFDAHSKSWFYVTKLEGNFL